MLKSILLTLTVLAAGPENSDEILKVLSSGYSVNCASIDRGNATFAISMGKAPDIDSAREMQFDITSRGVGSYRFMNNYKVYTLDYSTEDMIGNTKIISKKETSSILNPVQMVTNGKDCLFGIASLELNSKSLQHQAVINQDFKRFEINFSFPLNLGFKGLRVDNVAMDLDDAQPSSGAFTSYDLRRDVPFEGRSVFQVTLKSDRGERTYWIDGERGCIPVQVVDRNAKGAVTWKTNYDNIQKVGNKGWLPFRQTRYHSSLRRARVCDITKFDCEHDIPLSSFKVSFPQPISVVDTVRSIRHNKKTDFTVANLVSPSPGETKKIQLSHLPPPSKSPELPGERESNQRWITWTLFAVATFLISVVVLRWHGRRGNPRG